ncbi:MAG: protein phosphatase CheZ [Nitrospirae bacterium]|nr:protein phosphatase CheZ [Nitrospirota bacterium]
MQQYIGFHLNDSEYSIPILKVREIISMPELTKMPQSLEYIEGVTNLRGSIIPIVNLKKLVNLGNQENLGAKVIVVASGSMTFGVLVDDITGVITIDESAIEPPEKFMSSNMEQVEGVAKLKDRLIVLLDTRHLIPGEDMGAFEDVIMDVTESADGTVEVVKKVHTIAGETTIKETHDAKEFFEKRGINAQDPRYLIVDDLMSFMDAMAANDHEKADLAIQNIVKKGQSELFTEVGKMTRKMHDSIKSFRDALDPKLKDIANVEMPNAVDRLHFVISKTEEAANKTMGIVEKYLLGMDDLSAQIRKLKEPEDAISYLKTFRNGLEDDMTEILTTQAFQDLTGQTIKKVIKLVGEIESELVRLIATFGVKIDTGAVAEAPVAEQVSQSGVDDLLKDFGF